MNEQELRKRFRKGIAVCAIMGVLILGIGVSVLYILNNSMHSIIEEQMQTEAQNYKKRIYRQLRKDYESLDGLAVFMDGYSLEDKEKLSLRLRDAYKTNSFVSMLYVGRDGKGVMVNPGFDIRTDLDYHALGQGVQAVIEAAYEGERGVSPLFESTVTDHQVFAYSVPVYNESQTDVIGVLAASTHVEVFEELMDGEQILNGTDAVHLIDSKGRLLFSSTDPTNEMQLESLLYEPELFDEEAQADMRAALEKDESIFSSMTYNGKAYRVYLHPVGINGWYIMCVNNPFGISYLAHRMVSTLGITFGCLFLVAAILLVFIMRMNISNTQSLTKLAFKDPLTEADNMSRFLANLSRERESKAGFSLVALNIHQFKFVNEIMGVNAANEILLSICNSISTMLRGDEFFCRESGDIFYIFLRNTDHQIIRSKINHLIQEITNKAASGKKDYSIRLYAGILIWNGGTEEELSNELLITRTRFAMKSAKKQHTGNIYFYDEEVHKKEEMKNYVDTHMHQALENGEFHLFLQPKIDLKSNVISGAEALVRWITDEGKMIYPDMFIPQFEENGFCIQLDMYMFECACRQIREWMDHGIQPIQISVNQSKLLFFDTGYVSSLKAIIEKYQVPANLLTLEILENLVLDHAEELNNKLRELREVGFKISMDDFGSGYSSFNSLGSLEIDELKLDREFLMAVTKEKGERFRMIMAHIVHLTKSLNITTVAEGVETTENEELIQKIGCDYGQGYLYSRPVNTTEFSEKYMRDQ